MSTRGVRKYNRTPVLEKYASAHTKTHLSFVINCQFNRIDHNDSNKRVSVPPVRAYTITRKKTNVCLVIIRAFSILVQHSKFRSFVRHCAPLLVFDRTFAHSACELHRCISLTAFYCFNTQPDSVKSWTSEGGGLLPP